MLLCTDLAFSYGAVMRLFPTSFTAMPGSLFGVFGTNGSGKTTLLNMLAGVLPIMHGDVRLDGESLVGPRRYLKLGVRKKMGVLLQGASCDEKLSAFDNLIFFGRLMGLARKVAHMRAHEALLCATLGDRAHDLVKTFSVGMRRRLELYRTFMHEPRLVLLDEPTAGLDVFESVRFLSFLRDYQKRLNAIVVMVSHKPEELASAQQVLMMRDGAQLFCAEPQGLLDKIDYLRCRFAVMGAVPDLHEMGLFDYSFDEQTSVMKGKIRACDVRALHVSPLFSSGKLSSFTLEKPSLADVYFDLGKGDRGVQTYN